MSVAKVDDNRKVTTHRLIEMKQRGERIAILTAYDYSMAQLIDQAGMDVILVGDSASNVMAGNVTTLPITLDQMIYHGKSVMKAVNRALVVVDLPFGTYQGNSKEALASAIRVMKETHADCIKLEGGAEVRESIERILCAGIPIMGHLGLTPQSINKFGTYTVRAREEAEAKKLIEDAGAEVSIIFANNPKAILDYTKTVLNCDIHTRARTKKLLLNSGAEKVISLDEILTKSVDGSGYNDSYGLLGSNKATEESVKLFPINCGEFVRNVQKKLMDSTGKHIEVMVYGDGAFKDPVGKIWELADPVVSPA